MQYAILERARSLQALHELDLPRVAQPIFWAVRHRRVLRAAWAGYDAPPWRLTRLDLEVRAGDRLERTIALHPNASPEISELFTRVICK